MASAQCGRLARPTIRKGIQVQKIDWDMLREKATAATANAYAPYSKFDVGAAGLVDDGRIVTGCNVENASYGLTLCAECSMISELHRTGGGRLIAVATVFTVDGEINYGMPCGRCRQLLYEFGGPDCAVNIIHTVGDLLPHAFGPADLA